MACEAAASLRRTAEAVGASWPSRNSRPLATQRGDPDLGSGFPPGERGKNTGAPCYQIRGSTPWRALSWQRVSAADPARPATNVVSRSLLPSSTLSHNAALLAGCQHATARIANVLAAADGRHRQDRICRARTLRPDPCVGGATIRGLYASISLLRFALDFPNAVAAQCPPSYYGSLCTPPESLSDPFLLMGSLIETAPQSRNLAQRPRQVHEPQATPRELPVGQSKRRVRDDPVPRGVHRRGGRHKHDRTGGRDSACRNLDLQLG